MKILINVSNLVMGGAVQVAHSFLHELVKLNYSNIYVVCYTDSSLPSLDKSEFPENFKFVRIDCSPAIIYKRHKTIPQLRSVESSFKPDAVFTVMGPAYWKPRSIHICGFADGWVYNPKSVAYDQLNFIKKTKRRLLNKIKIFRLKTEAVHYILETNDARKKFSLTCAVSMSSLSVVSNTFNSIYTLPFQYKGLIKDSGTFKLLVLSAYYPHKNLDIINQVVELMPKDLDYTFYLTLPDDIYRRRFCDTRNVVNLGVQHISNCPEIISTSDAVFLPTLLETFTAVYPEAMVMGKPILTSNYGFAKDVCGDAAEYFNPLDAKNIRDKIVLVARDPARYEDLVRLGKKRVEIFPSANERAKEYINIIKKVINE